MLWGRQLNAEIAALTGDVGAKHLMTEHPELVTEVPAESEAVLTDIDTPEALAALAAQPPSPSRRGCDGSLPLPLAGEASLTRIPLTPAWGLYHSR